MVNDFIVRDVKLASSNNAYINQIYYTLILSIFFSDENYIEVQFHIKQGFLRVSEVMINAMTVDAVRAIVGCHSLNILKSYYDDSTNSVHLVIEEFFLKYLLSLTNEDKDILRNLEIDFFIVDFITVYLEHPKGKSRSITKRL